MIRKESYYELNKEKVKNYNKNYYINNKDKIKHNRRENYQKNKKKILEDMKNKPKYNIKYKCICDKTKLLTYVSKSVHERSKKHIIYAHNNERDSYIYKIYR